MFQFIQMGCTLKVQNTMPHVYCYQGSIHYEVRTGVQIKQARYKKVLLSTAFLFHFTIASLLFFFFFSFEKSFWGKLFSLFSCRSESKNPQENGNSKEFISILCCTLLQQYNEKLGTMVFLFYSVDKLKPKTKTKNQNIFCWCK